MTADLQSKTIVTSLDFICQNRPKFVSILNQFPPRILAFRDYMIRSLPRVPNTRKSLEAMRLMPTNQLILAFITWRKRLVPSKPRTVTIWSRGVTWPEFEIAKVALRPLLESVAKGNDLARYLSDLVNTSGVVLPDAIRGKRRRDIDMVLTRESLHHFHVGVVGPRNPKGRSKQLVFAEVLANEFRIVAISDHHAFEQGSDEHLRFFRICSAYMAKDIPLGQGFMANPVMASGHSLVTTMFADRCAHEIETRDTKLDDSTFVDDLYAARPVRDGAVVTRPPVSILEWHFADLQFGILDRATMVFFCIFPFYSR